MRCDARRVDRNPPARFPSAMARSQAVALLAYRPCRNGIGMCAEAYFWVIFLWRKSNHHSREVWRWRGMAWHGHGTGRPPLGSFIHALGLGTRRGKWHLFGCNGVGHFIGKMHEGTARRRISEPSLGCFRPELVSCFRESRSSKSCPVEAASSNRFRLFAFASG